MSSIDYSSPLLHSVPVPIQGPLHKKSRVDSTYQESDGPLLVNSFDDDMHRKLSPAVPVPVVSPESKEKMESCILTLGQHNKNYHRVGEDSNGEIGTHQQLPGPPVQSQYDFEGEIQRHRPLFRSVTHDSTSMAPSQQMYHSAQGHNRQIRSSQHYQHMDHSRMSPNSEFLTIDSSCKQHRGDQAIRLLVPQVQVSDGFSVPPHCGPSTSVNQNFYRGQETHMNNVNNNLQNTATSCNGNGHPRPSPFRANYRSQRPRYNQHQNPAPAACSSLPSTQPNMNIHDEYRGAFDAHCDLDHADKEVEHILFNQNQNRHNACQGPGPVTWQHQHQTHRQNQHQEYYQQPLPRMYNHRQDQYYPSVQSQAQYYYPQHQHHSAYHQYNDHYGPSYSNPQNDLYMHQQQQHHYHHSHGHGGHISTNHQSYNHMMAPPPYTYPYIQSKKRKYQEETQLQLPLPPPQRPDYFIHADRSASPMSDITGSPVSSFDENDAAVDEELDAMAMQEQLPEQPKVKIELDEEFASASRNGSTSESHMMEHGKSQQEEPQQEQQQPLHMADGHTPCKSPRKRLSIDTTLTHMDDLSYSREKSKEPKVERGSGKKSFSSKCDWEDTVVLRTVSPIKAKVIETEHDNTNDHNNENVNVNANANTRENNCDREGGKVKAETTNAKIWRPREDRSDPSTSTSASNLIITNNISRTLSDQDF